MNKNVAAAGLLGVALAALVALAPRERASLTPEGKPAPPPSPIAAYVVVVTQRGCAPCSRMRADLDADKAAWAGIDVRWVDANTWAARKYRARATPTAIKFSGGREVGRREGYLSPADLAAWAKSPFGDATPLN